MADNIPQSAYKPNPEMLNIFRDVVQQGSLPKILYKYWSADGAKRFLKTGQILFNRYTKFNDPFDCSAVLDTQNSPDEWLKYLLSQGVSCSEAIFLASKLAQNPTKASEILKDTIERQKLANGIFCTSGKCDSLLMWAHYADDHKGMCIGFDLSKDMETFCPTKKVEYTEEFLHYNYLRYQGGAADALFRKSKEWEYEDEYRTLHMNGYGLMDVKPDAVAEIILGCGISDTDAKEVIKLAAKFPCAEIKRASKNRTRYALDFS